MIQSVAISTRSVLIAGMSAAVVAGATVTPVNSPALTQAKITSIATQLTGIETTIKNTYNAIEPWAAWGAALGQWALGFIPGLWWVAPGVSLAYYTIEPLVQAGVYSFADVLGGNFAQIGPDVSQGIQSSWNNAVTYSLAWLNSIVPLPPFPPFPPLPGIAAATAPAAAAATVVAGTTAKSITTPIEVAIKNTYNAVQPWVAYGMQWVNYVAGLIPVVNWFSPAIPLTYYTVEPLVRAGTYAFADLIGLNFAAIGPDVWNGITTSANNFVTGILNWANIPLPPRPPAAALTAPAASLRAAAAVTAPAEVDAPEAPAVPPAETGSSPKADNSPATGKDTPGVTEHSAPAAPVVASEAIPPAGDSSSSTGTTTAAAPAIDVTPPAAINSPATDTGTSRTAAHRGRSGSTTATGESSSAGAPAKPGRHARGAD